MQGKKRTTPQCSAFFKISCPHASSILTDLCICGGGYSGMFKRYEIEIADYEQDRDIKEQWPVFQDSLIHFSSKDELRMVSSDLLLWSSKPIWLVVLRHLTQFFVACSDQVDVTLVSPRNYFLYTPLLPAAATGTVEERSIVEPVRKMLGNKVSTISVILWIPS